MIWRKRSIDDIKSSSLFSKKDIFVYVATATIVSLLFLALFIFKPIQKTDGVKITVNNQTILTYSFLSDKFDLTKEFEDKIEICNFQDGYKITISLSEKQFNQITINSSKKTFAMTGSSCTHKTCTLMNDFIFCSPNSLSVSYISDSFIPPVIG